MEKIYQASIKHLELVSTMLYSMYTEVEPELASKSFPDYVELGKEHLKNDDVYLYEDKAMFIMRDISSPVINRQMWDGVSVYIRPNYRNTKILSELYKYMFDNYQGTIIGFVEPNSKHYNIVSKRNKLMGYLYQLNRPKKEK